MEIDDLVGKLATDLGLGADQHDAVLALVRAVADGPRATIDTGDRITLVDDEEPAPPPAERGALPPRYGDLGPIGIGGMGEVRRVRDRELGRAVAMKVIRAELMSRPQTVSRFVEEAQVAAQLQHPGIVPVHDFGRLPDGRWYFTMKEVRGRTLSTAIREVHEASREASRGASGAAWTPAPSGWTLHRLVDAFVKVCDAIGYAHARGVVHRDLKPDNVMVGGFGEVMVLDWGIAKVVGRPDRAAADGDLDPERLVDEDVVTSRSAGAARTRMGSVSGTASYMPPEQAAGEIDRIDARSDVYALGGLLYEILSGRPPYDGPDARAVLLQVLTGPPRPLGPDPTTTFSFGEDARPTDALPLPAELVDLCERAMAREPDDRPADGLAVAAEARAWLEGARKAEQARRIVEEAATRRPEAAAMRELAAELREQAAEDLAVTKPWEPEERKAGAWAMEDRAAELVRKADAIELEAEFLLRGALTHAPDLPEAHAALAARYAEEHAAAEAARDDVAAARAELRLRHHVDALPPGHADRRAHLSRLAGVGSLSLVTGPPANVELYRYEIRNRRRVPIFVRGLGKTPLKDVPLPMGSYLCLLRAEGRPIVRYPVHVGRGERWDGGAVPLPSMDDLGPDDVYVPPGWFWSGDPGASPGDPLPRRRLYADGFVVRRFPVTNAEYIAFLDDLVAQGREADAMAWVPRERSGASGREGAPLYARDAEGRFVLVPDGEGDVWLPEFPVFLVHFGCAAAYAAWYAEKTGLPWRLLGELEWEKASRGVDGRIYPWGDFLDASWCRMRDSHTGRPLPGPVDANPVDESPYGVRGMGGNVEDWCGDPWRKEGPELDGDRVVPPELPRDLELSKEAWRARRGGHWYCSPSYARVGRRAGFESSSRITGLGFRIARSWP